MAHTGPRLCRTARFVPLALVLAFLASTVALASPTPVTITLREEPGVYTGCQDTFLNEVTAYQDHNYGDYDYLGVEHDAEHYQDKTTLIYFNLTGQIPSNACIKEAKLKLYQYDTLEMGADDWLKIGAYRLMKSWDEGTGGTNNGASWLQRKVGTSYPWAKAGARRPCNPADPGTDPDRHKTYSSPYAGVVDDYQTCTTATIGSYIVWDVTPSVQYWHGHSSANYGMVLDKWWEAPGGYAYDDDSEVRFRSRDYATISQRPVLQITYVVPTSEPLVELRLADLNLNFWNTDPAITFSSNSGQLWCSGTTSDAIWGADGSATSYTTNSGFECAIKVKLEDGVVGEEQGEFGFGMYEPSTNDYIRILAVGFSAQYYEISGVCAASGNAHYHDGSAYWASYWDDDYPTAPASKAVRFFSETAENEATSYLTWKVRYDNDNNMFYVLVNDVLVTYYSKVDFANWRIGIMHDNNRSGVATSVWTDFPDTTPPTPDPMTWATPPAAVSVSSIDMTATTATDWSHPPVSYLFTETTGGGHSSSWQSGTYYADSGLSANTQYGYKVKARDSYSPPNETSYSTTVSRYTLMPTPTGVSAANIGATSADLTALGSLPNLNQGSSGIQFKSGVTSFPWSQTNPTTVSPLTPNTQYTFYVKARNGDAIETGWSAGSAAFRTKAAAPAAMAYNPVSTIGIRANWGANGNPYGTEYFCRETVTGQDSGWITDTGWTLLRLTQGTSYRFEVKARNADHEETGWVDLGWVQTSITVGKAKKDYRPGVMMTLGNKVVTAVFQSQQMIFVEDWPVFGRSEGWIGIGVHFTEMLPPFVVGDRVDLTGTLQMNDPPYDKELVMVPTHYLRSGLGLPVAPLPGSGSALGGATFGGQELVYDNLTYIPGQQEEAVPSHGLNTVGSLVTLFGKFDDGGLNGNGFFWVDDGSLLYDANGGEAKGVRVDLAPIGGVFPGQPPYPAYVSVTGILRCVMVESPYGRMNVRTLWPRTASDIMFLLPGEE